MKTAILLKLFTAAMLLCASVAAQQPAAGDQSFRQDGLSFDYPSGWTLTDRSNERAQELTLTKPGTTSVVRVIAQRDHIGGSGQFKLATDSITTPLVNEVARGLGLSKPTREQNCMLAGGRIAMGDRMRGQIDGRAAAGEVYSLVYGRRLVHLVRVRADADEGEAARAWKTVLDSLRVEPPADLSPEAEKMPKVVSGGVVNGKALKKPQPRYPSAAMAARAQGVTVVQIVVDEKGDVASAQMVSGHPALREAAEEAAREAKFKPTLLCGVPVKVSGVITYNFVLQ